MLAVGGQRRLSKAQVLDLSARYIRSLERERNRLEEEREVLFESVQRLRERCGWEWRGEGG
jgi:predicted nuclease with TOPRIM domain